jgi:hypothetical protein
MTLPTDPLFGPYGDPTDGPVDRYRTYGANAVWFHPSPSELP